MKKLLCPHVWLDERGVAWIDETNVKVVEVVLDKLAHDSTPEEMAQDFPHLTVAQIYAALGYYHDHRQEIDADIAERNRFVEEFRKQQGESPLRQRLREQGLIP